MLHSETKRKIDNARDILVGKIPVPSAQIELITIALVYKFMSDIDEQNKELGSAGFFVGEYEKYSWPNLMDRKLGAHDRLYLYSEGLEKMGTNPHLPQMFRDIFRNAFLPFKNPQTLDRFLKQIGEFTYDHSEELGNAFEYLLSTAGSQGDAGQFRTPRHIIDFIVEIVEPKHTDTILDPACGTAGFLISAYKYILSSNTQKTLGDQLTLAQKNKLTENFVGYDISHEMVRLSLVNLYLHNFGDPKIFEYDTLSSDERREERFDCILANPPFMTPKGGIQPHNRFSVKASKSEVLFVDYMMDHLNPNGKAGIIVPEGIIFQSANAYKSLRQKMITENYLRAVVSLPSGVFQPYSGVKTSILLFDKELAKKSDNILFVKVNQDGYDLGAQRRPTPDKNDLPKVLEDILLYKQGIQAEKEPLPLDHSFLLVPKCDIIENGDYNLSMERYRTSELANSDWPMVELGEVIELVRGVTYSKKDEVEDCGIKILRANNINLDGSLNLNDIKTIDSKIMINDDKKLKKNDVFICLASGSKSHIGKVAFIEEDTEYYFGGFMGVIRYLNPKKIDPKYLFYNLKDKKFNEYLDKTISGVNINNLNAQILQNYKIPLPPLEVQEQIVAELDGYQKIINGAKQIVENYKPTIKIDPEWEMVELGEVADFVRGPFGGSLKKEIFVNSGYAVYEQSHAIYSDFSDFRYFIDQSKYEEMIRFTVEPFDLIMSCSGTMGKTAIIPIDAPKGIINQALLKLTTKENLNVKFLKLWMDSKTFQDLIYSNVGGSAIQNVASVKVLSALEIPLPTLAIQEQIVAQIEKEQEMVDSAKGLIEVFEGKVKEKIGEVWGE